MMIKAKPIPLPLIRWGSSVLIWFFRRRFNKMKITPVDIKPNHSYVLMCNHFGFLDGFFSYYIAFKHIDKQQKLKGLYTMSVKKQMEKNWWLKYVGSFSVEPTAWSVKESIEYAAELLNTPGNILLFFPQAELESQHIRHIEFKNGINEIMTRVKGDCQLIWSSNVLEYYESTKPSANMTLLDCGTNHDFDFKALKQNVNVHHLQSMRKTVRFTDEPGNLTY